MIPESSRGCCSIQPAGILPHARLLVRIERTLVGRLRKLLRDDALRGRHQRGDRGRIGERRAHDLRRVDDALLDHIDVLASLRIEAQMPILLAKQRLHDDGALFAGVLRNLDARLAQGGPDSINADLLVQAIQLQILQLSGRIEERGAAAGDDALLERSLRGAERIVEPVLHLVDLHLRGATDLDDSDTAGELCQALLELVLLVLGGGELDGVPDGLAALLDAGLVARGVQEHGVVLRDGHSLDAAELGELHILELGAELVGEELRAREHRQVLHDGLAIVAKARRLHRTDL
mmetsp:Transcript_95080/g.268669  ORF Transcript_95080/g.268669 Transcript_95080/m.268669 type:complete len:292 (+) Transcript_95080:189-1064(+)